MLIKTEAITLKTMPYSESSLILILFSKESGRISALAKGVRKSKKSHSGLMQTFMHNTYSISKKSGMGIITEVHNINHFPNISKDLDKLRDAYSCLDIINHLCQENHPQPIIFNELIRTLQQIENSYDNYMNAVTDFKEMILENEGIKPQIRNTDIIHKTLEDYLDHRLKVLI